MKDFNPKKHVGLLIKFLNNSIVNEINRQLSIFNLTSAQHEILFFIKRHEAFGDVFQKDIEKHLKLTNPTVTGIVKRLEEKDMIARCPSEEDARYKCIHVTDKGRETLKRSYEFGIKKVETRLVKDMTKAEEDQFRELLCKALKNLEE